ncbi:MAG: VanZ family protein [Deltaproteobacteria bacterium]|nr:VanZ family protein [Deltaproteobacteria bacterium]
MTATSIVSYAVLIIYAVVILFFSTAGIPEGMPEVWQIDKAYHFGAYAIMGWLTAMALRRPILEKPFSMPGGKVVGLSFAVTFLFGAVIEVFQHYIPGRNAEMLDAVANGAGGLVGALIYVKLRRRKGVLR